MLATSRSWRPRRSLHKTGGLAQAPDRSRPASSRWTCSVLDQEADPTATQPSRTADIACQVLQPLVTERDGAGWCSLQAAERAGPNGSGVVILRDGRCAVRGMSGLDAWRYGRQPGPGQAGT